MGFSKGSSSISYEDIFSVVSEFEILAYYLNISQLPCVINSPLRPDNKPSFGLYTRDGVRVFYRDFRTRESGGTIDLLSNLWGVSYKQTLIRITEDLPKFAKSNNSVITRSKRHKSRKVYSTGIDLNCKVRPWKRHDLDYWEQYGISKEWLEFGRVYPISHTIITKNNKQIIIPAEKHAYAYVEFKDNVTSLKIYQPYSTLYKWTNKHDSSVWDLWEQLPETGENLIITSSRKDALCIWENTEIPSCSLQAESYLPKYHVVQQLKDRFKNVFVLYDNDFNSEMNYGRLLGEGMADEFGLIQLEIPEKYQSKDPSDLCLNFNRQKVKEVIPYLIKEKIS